MTVRDLFDLFGFLAGLAAIAGSLLLAFPLFHLLRAREAIEDLEITIEGGDISNEERAEFQTSLYDLKRHVRTRRGRAINIGLVGLLFLILAVALLALQAWQWHQ